MFVGSVSGGFGKLFYLLLGSLYKAFKFTLSPNTPVFRGHSRGMWDMWYVGLKAKVAWIHTYIYV